MRTKQRTTAQLKTGMIVRLDFATSDFKKITSVTRGPWPRTRYITFTDGTGQWYHLDTGWTVARGKTIRTSIRSRAALIPSHKLADTLGLLATYATRIA